MFVLWSVSWWNFPPNRKKKKNKTKKDKPDGGVAVVNGESEPSTSGITKVRSVLGRQHTAYNLTVTHRLPSTQQSLAFHTSWVMTPSTHTLT